MVQKMGAMAGSGPPAASGRIFISYRREETAYPAGWLYDRLADRFGGRQVFKDVDSNEGKLLAPGETVNAQGRRLLDGAGSWEFWPCYELGDGRQCPDKWQVFFILAE